MSTGEEKTRAKIKELEFEYARTQKNKATEGHLGLLKAKIAKLQRELVSGLPIIPCFAYNTIHHLETLFVHTCFYILYDIYRSLVVETLEIVLHAKCIFFDFEPKSPSLLAYSSFLIFIITIFSHLNPLSYLLPSLFSLSIVVHLSIFKSWK